MSIALAWFERIKGWVTIDRAPAVQELTNWHKIYKGRTSGRKVPMALSIKSPEVERKVRQLAAVTGESITSVIMIAVDEQLKREERRRESKQFLIDDLMAIAKHCASLPVLDDRSEDEIIGWDENGLPT